jgi:hypothetical protein
MLVKQTFTTRRMIDLLFNHQSLWWPLGKWLCTETKYSDNSQLYISGSATAILQNQETTSWRQTVNQSKLISQPSELERELQQLNEMEIQTIPNDVMGFLNISQDQQQLQSDDHSKKFFFFKNFKRGIVSGASPGTGRVCPQI